MFNEHLKSNCICAIIVTYNPDFLTIGQILNKLADQVNRIIIIDNFSQNGFCDWIKAEKNYKNMTFFLNENMGLGYAYNLGVKKARESGCSHIILFDQDSVPESNMVIILMNAFNNLKQQGYKISAVGPVYHDLRTDLFSPFMRLGWFRFNQIKSMDSIYVPADFLISSGSLISLETINDIGTMDESLFIDKIDIEWFLRARSLGYCAWGVSNAFMEHSIGESARQIWGFRRKIFFQHKPFRYYYIFRNSFLLYRREYMSVKWMSADIISLLQIFVFLLLTGRSREKIFQMIFKGIFDGVKGISGKLE
ncbi:MAG: glycosyltransferase family 2 protein [Nitrospiraceae bacterium]|nr:glycosyltransferase family 2 protein [Nitrospiraceae bacterium]